VFNSEIRGVTPLEARFSLFWFAAMTFSAGASVFIQERQGNVDILHQQKEGRIRQRLVSCWQNDGQF
jgi:hypothetical protein